MNRRQFSQILSAFVATPLAPVKALVPAAGAIRPLHTYQHPYCWAAFLARVHNRASPAMFQRHFNLSPAEAEDVMQVLVREDVVSMAGSSGVFNVTAPFRRSVHTINAFKTKLGNSAPQPSGQHGDVKIRNNEAVDSPSLNQRLQISEDAREPSQDTTRDAAQNDAAKDQLDPVDPLETRGPRDISSPDT